MLDCLLAPGRDPRRATGTYAALSGSFARVAPRATRSPVGPGTTVRTLGFRARRAGRGRSRTTLRSRPGGRCASHGPIAERHPSSTGTGQLHPRVRGPPEPAWAVKRARRIQDPSRAQIPSEGIRQRRTACANSDRAPVGTEALAAPFVANRGYRDQQPERLPSEAGDLPQLLVDPAACDQYCGRVRRAQPGTADTLRSVVGGGASLDALVGQEPQRLGLLLRAELSASNHSMPVTSGVAPG